MSNPNEFQVIASIVAEASMDVIPAQPNENEETV